MILIVEDDPIARRALQSLFAANGYPSRTVSSAEDALEALAGSPEHPELVLIDIDLPGMSGLQLLKAVQAQHPGVSCSLMSANDEARPAGDAPRAVPFFPKPLDWKHLLASVGGEMKASSH
jgi:cyclic di-GMP phosphodiesterase